MSARALSWLAIGLGSFGLPSLAVNAQPPSARLVELMTPHPASGRKHPLADGEGRIPFLVSLPKGTSAAELGLLEIAPGIASGRYQPADYFDFVNHHPELTYASGPTNLPLLNEVAAHLHLDEFVAATEGAGTGAGVVVGVVDTGIDIRHPTFRNVDGSTRIAWLLTWGPPRGYHPELEERFGCTSENQARCAVYSADEINEFLKDDSLTNDLRDPVGHGTHVASIAAGNGQGPVLGTFTALSGIAPEATLVIAAPSENGGFGDGEIIRGCDFIFERAEAMGMPAVANLSLGGEYGPHDGTSLLEKGTAAFVAQNQPGRVIVAAAGNSGGLYKLSEDETDDDRLGSHTEIHVEPHAPAEVPILVPGAEGGDLYIWITFRPGDEVSVGLEGPNDEGWIGLVGPGDESGYTTDDVTAAVINNLVNENSSINPDTNSAVVAISGNWEKDSQFRLLFEGSGDAQMWVVARGTATSGAYFRRATVEGTVNQPATHPDVLAVGCTVNRLRWGSRDVGLIEIPEFGGSQDPRVDMPCYFSGAGPTPLGVAKPEITAPGAFVAAALGEDASPDVNDDSIFNPPGCPTDDFCFLLTDEYAIQSGTSMSSPVVAGAVALLLQQRPELTQAAATELIQASARKPNAGVRYQAQTGAGALDLKNALQALAEEPETGEAPSLGNSFWYLSGEHPRPDETWPIKGIIQLRRDDGTLASGLSASSLSIDLDGGVLVEAPRKISHGTYTFTIAGPNGGGGTNLRVGVLYDGKPIGETQVLSVGIDTWAGGGIPTVTGGLCSASGVKGGGAATGWALSLLLLTLRRRARRL